MLTFYYVVTLILNIHVTIKEIQLREIVIP